MTTISIDLASVLGVRPDGIVSIAATPDRPGVAGGWVSGASGDVPMVAGVAMLTGVEPGPARLMVRADAGHDSDFWSEEWQVIVPDQPTVTFADLVDDQTVWPVPVVAAAQQARNESRAARDESRGYRDQARQAAEEMEGGVRPGGWLMDDMSVEVIAAMGGGVTIPAGGWLKTDLATAVRASLDLADTASQPGHTHPVADLATTGAAEGWVVTRGPGGVAAWAAPAGGGGTPGVRVAQESGSLVEPTGTSVGSVAIGSRSALGSARGAIAVGEGTKALAESAVAIGYYANAGLPAMFSVAVGGSAQASHLGSTALGNNSATTKAGQVMLGRPADVVTMPGKAELGTGSVQVTLSTRLEGGKVELGVTFPGSSTFIPIATQP